MTKTEILKKSLDMAYHNLLCYSENYLTTKFKEGYEEDWKSTLEEVEILESMIKEIENPPIVKITLDQLERAILGLKQQRQYYNKSSYLNLKVCVYPYGLHYLVIEQIACAAGDYSYWDRIDQCIKREMD